jgi:hypothetical protein
MLGDRFVEVGGVEDRGILAAESVHALLELGSAAMWVRSNGTSAEDIAKALKRAAWKCFRRRLTRQWRLSTQRRQRLIQHRRKQCSQYARYNSQDESAQSERS